jgi:ankyrin repeat protein
MEAIIMKFNNIIIFLFVLILNIRSIAIFADSDYMLSFIDAIDDGDEKKVEALLKKKAVDANLSSFFNKQNNADNELRPMFIVTQKILNEKNIDKKDSYLRIAKKLIEYGANINISNKSQESPLLLAITNRYLPFIYLLISNNANCNIQNAKGETPLMLAVKDKNEKLVNILLKHKANCNISNLKGATPIYKACKMGEVRIASLLIKAGCKLESKRNKIKGSLIEIAYKKNDNKMQNLLLKMTPSKYLKNLILASLKDNNDRNSKLARKIIKDSVRCYNDFGSYSQNKELFVLTKLGFDLSRCAICLSKCGEDPENPDNIKFEPVSLLACGHCFCKKCIDEVRDKNKNNNPNRKLCPLDRIKIKNKNKIDL